VTKDGVHTFETKIEDRSSVICIDKTKVETCYRCKGIGWYTTEEEDFSGARGDTKTVRRGCNLCSGDGRVVVTTRSIKFYADNPETRYVPFAEFKGDPWAEQQTQFNIKIDRRNKRLEQRHPALKALSYNNYDSALERYETLDRIKDPK
jgi:hypothetical protein